MSAPEINQPRVSPAQLTAAVIGLFDFRGTHDASGNTYPTTGGSGTSGAILKGDAWKVSVAGMLGGAAVLAGDLLLALVDTPGSTAGNWWIEAGVQSPIVEIHTAGEAIAANKAVYLHTDGKIYKAVNNDTAAKANAIGVTMSAINQDASGRVITIGPLVYASWTWTTGGDVYVGSTAGELTQTLPTAPTANWVKPIGHGGTITTQLVVDPQTGWAA